MRIHVALLTLILALTVGACTQPIRPPAAAKAPMEDAGSIKGAPYRIDIPSGWNGRLVMLQHGYEPVGVPREQPWPQNELTPVFLSMGYAVAASAYSTQGMAVAEAINDVHALFKHFVTRHGKPQATYLVGVSLGGHITLAVLERFGEAYAGALSLCGLNVPLATMIDDGIVTPLIALDHFFPQALSLPPGGLIDPDAPPMVDQAAVEAALASDEATAALLATRLEVPRHMLAGAMMLNYMVLRELQQRAGGHPLDNRNMEYTGFGDDDAFNRGARRYPAQPQAVDYLRRHGELNGRINAPVVLLSNRVDPTIPPRFARMYPELVAAAGRSKYLVDLPKVGETHCDITPEQISTAFGDLVGWVERGAKPANGNQ